MSMVSKAKDEGSDLDFNKTSNNVLRNNLEALEVYNRPVTWITNRLAIRTCFVRINKDSSIEAKYLSGVHQVSIIDPVLFLFIFGQLKVYTARSPMIPK